MGSRGDLSAGSDMMKAVLTSMWMTRITIGMILMLGVVVPGQGVGLVMHLAQAQRQAEVSSEDEDQFKDNNHPTASQDRARVRADDVNAQIVLKGHTREVYSLAFSPDGKTLASTSQGQVMLWDVNTRKEARMCAGILLADT